MVKYSTQLLDNMYKQTSRYKQIRFMKKTMNFYSKHYLDGKHPKNWSANEVTSFIIKASDKLNYENSTIENKVKTIRYILRGIGNPVYEKSNIHWVSQLVSFNLISLVPSKYETTYLETT